MRISIIGQPGSGKTTLANKISEKFKTPHFQVDRFYLDGWILFGWLTILFLLKDLKKNFVILIPFIAYFIVYVFGIPNEPAHGWYRYPFYPFLIISTALMLKEEFKKISLISMVFLLIVGLSLLSNVWQNLFGFSFTVYRSFILLATIPILYLLWKNKTSSKLMYSWLVLFLILNVVSVLSYVE